MRTLEDVDLKEGERRAIREAAKRLRKHLPVEQVILYGSKARGDGDANSDVDLLLLTSRPLHWSERSRVIDVLYPLQVEYDVWFSPLSVSSYDWSEGVYQVLPIHDEVERDGVSV